jgi:exodeoxyribonuclease VIII
VNDRAAYDAIDAVNWSTLKYALKSGMAYKHILTHETPESDAMRFGRLTHALVFEPTTLAAEFAVWAGGRRAGGEWEQFRNANILRTIVREEDMTAALEIQAAVRAHPIAAALLLDGEAEQTVTWTDADTGIACKGRLDWLTPSALVDLKTTRDVDVRAFGQHAAALLYHCQLAFYQMGLDANGMKRTVKIIAVESDAPHDVAVFDLNEDVLWAGEVKARQALATVKRCRETRTWPGRYPQEVGFMLPAYAFPTDDETDAAMRGEE